MNSSNFTIENRNGIEVYKSRTRNFKGKLNQEIRIDGEKFKFHSREMKPLSGISYTYFNADGKKTAIFW